MLSSSVRIKKGDFDKLKKEKSRSFSTDNFTLKIFQSNSNTSCFAVVVSSKTSKKAVDRNKIKRHVKNIISVNLKKIRSGMSVIIYTKKNSLKTPFRDIEIDLLGLFKKANILND
ncbi:MAG: ribonuclease P protein component [Patescibacteria group bacterium]